jgi:hypothetical protein
MIMQVYQSLAFSIRAAMHSGTLAKAPDLGMVDVYVLPVFPQFFDGHWDHEIPGGSFRDVLLVTYGRQ